MDNNVENSQIEEFIANLKGRKAYEEKKAIKLGFSNFEDYVADIISSIISESSTICKASKQRVRRKNKTKTKPVATCGCCWYRPTIAGIKPNRYTQLNSFKVLLLS